MPGVCPACGRDLRLEEIAAKLGQAPAERPAKKSPMGLGECAGCSVIPSLLLCMVDALFLDMRSELELLVFLMVFFVAAPNFFFGFVVAGYWSRTKLAQLCFGFLLGLGFMAASMAVLYVGCRRM
jgi:hypothetical protein